MRTTLFLLFSIFCLQARAVLVDTNLDIFQGTLVRSTTRQTAKTFGTMGIFANLSKSENGRLYIGWNVMSVSSTDDLTTGINEKLTSLDMGPAFRWNIDRRNLFSLTLAYGIVCNGKYEITGATEETLTGTSYLAKIGIEPELSENWNLGFGINYYAATYTKKVVDHVESEPGYTNTWLFPTVSLVWRY